MHPDDEPDVLKFRRKGWSIRRIAKRLFTYDLAVRRVLAKLGDPCPTATVLDVHKAQRPAKPLTPEELTARAIRIRELKAQGLTVRAIAAEVGTSVGTVQRALAPEPPLSQLEKCLLVRLQEMDSSENPWPEEGPLFRYEHLFSVAKPSVSDSICLLKATRLLRVEHYQFNILPNDLGNALRSLERRGFIRRWGRHCADPEGWHYFNGKTGAIQLLDPGYCVGLLCFQEQYGREATLQRFRRNPGDDAYATANLEEMTAPYRERWGFPPCAPV